MSLSDVGCVPPSCLTAQEERDQLVDVDVSAFPHLLQEAYAEESAAGSSDDDGEMTAADDTATVQMAIPPSERNSV